MLTSSKKLLQQRFNAFFSANDTLDIPGDALIRYQDKIRSLKESLISVMNMMPRRGRIFHVDEILLLMDKLITIKESPGNSDASEFSEILTEVSVLSKSYNGTF
jgi:hypothetical protein